MTLIERAREAWMKCASLRETRRRLMRYTYGRQWDDPVRHPVHGIITEGQFMELQHRTPLTNNLLRSLVKGVVGRFRYNLALAASGDTEGPQLFGQATSRLPEGVAEGNRIDELDARMLEEFLISGCAIQHISVEGRPGGGPNVWVDNVSPARFFCNRFLDHRGQDLRLVGMIHEMSREEMLMRFGRSKSKAKVVAKAFAASSGELRVAGVDLAREDDNESFDYPSDPELCRVIEVWTYEVDVTRRRPTGKWMCSFMTADGTELKRMESPFGHGEHPFVIKFYPLTDGEVHPFIEDVIDQQRHINRLISEIDTVLAHAAKGTLLFPQEALIGGMTVEQQVGLWNQPGAVITYKGGPDNMPREVHSTLQTQGVSQLLETEMQLFRQISGVSAALQGESVGNSTSASLYDAQVANSTIGLLDIFATFNSFRAMRDEKVMRSGPGNII